MELNLERLKKLGVSEAKPALGENPPATSPAERLSEGSQGKDTTGAKKPAERLVEANTALQRKAETQRANIDRSLEICKEYQANIRKTETLQAEILKGAGAGADIYQLFLKAVEAIALMTSNQPFLRQIEGNIKTVYGKGLLEPAPLKMELGEVEYHLVKLGEALSREDDPDSLQQIRRAIQAHEKRKAELRSLIAKAEERPA